MSTDVHSLLTPVLHAIDDLVRAVKPDLIKIHSVNLIITGDCNIHCV